MTLLYLLKYLNERQIQPSVSVAPGNHVYNKRTTCIASSTHAEIKALSIQVMVPGVDKLSLVPRPSPTLVFKPVAVFCTLQAIKNWGQRRPGNEARQIRMLLLKQ